jgi:outer membrane protein OmpA-like peptidoglycan-associated protein
VGEEAVRRGVRRAPVVLAAGLAAALGLGCSAYQKTYDTELERLETEDQARQEQEKAAHAEASKFAAVVYFATGSVDVDADGRRELGWFVEKMKPYPQAVIEVRGFADSTGADATNQRISNQRAANVAQVLSSLGIESSRLAVEAYSEQSPAATNASAQGRRSNRRVEVTVR